MYRHREFAQVVYGHWNDFIKAQHELNAVSRKRSWPESSIWAPVVGTGNQVAVEREFADLTAFAKFQEAFQSDSDAMKIYRGMSSLVVQGSVHDELFQEVIGLLA